MNLSITQIDRRYINHRKRKGNKTSPNFIVKHHLYLANLKFFGQLIMMLQNKISPHRIKVISRYLSAWVDQLRDKKYCHTIKKSHAWIRIQGIQIHIRLTEFTLCVLQISRTLFTLKLVFKKMATVYFLHKNKLLTFDTINLSTLKAAFFLMTFLYCQVLEIGIKSMFKRDL